MFFLYFLEGFSSFRQENLEKHLVFSTFSFRKSTFVDSFTKSIQVRSMAELGWLHGLGWAGLAGLGWLTGFLAGWMLARLSLNPDLERSLIIKSRLGEPRSQSH